MGLQLETWQLVEAPAAFPLRYGFFSVAEPRLTTDDHWRLGVQWQSQSCSPAKRTTGPCIDPEVDPLTPDDFCSVVQYEPFTVYAYENDDIIGATLAEHEAHAIARLTNGEQYAVEQQFWGLVTTAPAVTTTDLSGAPAGVVLGYIEQILANNYFGQGVIHMDRFTATILWEYLDVSGARLQTRLGTPVIAGGGYGNMADPPVDEFFIYGTGPVVVYRGDIDTRQMAIAKETNQVSYIAQRDYVVGYDCGGVGVKGTLGQVPFEG
jgi:hypothetical protein